MPPVDWGKLFVFTVSPFELVLRGTVVYLLIRLAGLVSPDMPVHIVE